MSKIRALFRNKGLPSDLSHMSGNQYGLYVRPDVFLRVLATIPKSRADERDVSRAKAAVESGTQQKGWYYFELPRNVV